MLCCCRQTTSLFGICAAIEVELLVLCRLTVNKYGWSISILYDCFILLNSGIATIPDRPSGPADSFGDKALDSLIYEVIGMSCIQSTYVLAI